MNDDAFSPSLLPFLAVLSCTIGALILVLVAVSVEAAANADQMIDFQRTTAEDTDKQVVFVECDSTAWTVYRVDEQNRMAVDLELGRDSVLGSEQAFRELPAADGLTEMETLAARDDPTFAFLLDCYRRRVSHYVVLLIRPGGDELFRVFFHVVRYFNGKELAAGREKLDYGYDALLSGGKLEFREVE